MCHSVEARVEGLVFPETPISLNEGIYLQNIVGSLI